jgi:membrane-bound acyltransferase YfiQ involved in biofilm formation
LIIEVENIFWVTHISPHIYYKAGLLALFGWLKVDTTSSFFALFENKSAVHKLQSSQNPLSFAYNFFQWLTFANDFFPLVLSCIKYSRLLSRRGQISARLENGPARKA